MTIYKHRKSFAGFTTLAILAGLLFASGLLHPVSTQTLDFERQRGLMILDTLKSDIKKNYYDPKFRGIDLDARFKAAEEKIKKAQSVGQVQAIIAQTLVDFNDSHLFYIAPGKASRTEYGWRMQMIGDKAYIVAVQPGSDAEAKGVKPGDEVYSLDGFEPTRENMWKMNYFYHTLRPKPAVKLVLISPEGKQRELEVKSKITEGKRIRTIEDVVGDETREMETEAHLNRHRFAELEKDAYVWKMPEFNLSEAEVDGIIDKAKKFRSLIIDLRGNPGGYEITQLRLVGNLFDHDVKVGDITRRKETKPLIAKTRGANAIFKGQVVVLIDSNSASSSEIFARVMQIEKRATVIGDRSAGAVMRARQYGHEVGTDIVAFYAASITDADLIMTDGKSLEHTGVTPDELVLPKAADMAAGRDPVLARAAGLLGIKMDAEKAGKLFPVEWRK